MPTTNSLVAPQVGLTDDQGELDRRANVNSLSLATCHFDGYEVCTGLWNE